MRDYCSLCGFYIEKEDFVHTKFNRFVVCLACYSDMDSDTEIAFHKFVECLAKQKPEYFEIGVGK